MVIIELYKSRVTHMIYNEKNEEFSKSKTTKLFCFTRYPDIFSCQNIKFAIAYWEVFY